MIDDDRQPDRTPEEEAFGSRAGGPWPKVEALDFAAPGMRRYRITYPLPPAAPLSTLPMPCHDQPVAWRSLWGGVEVVICPAMLPGTIGNFPPRLIGKIPEGIVVLDEEPGRLA